MRKEDESRNGKHSTTEKETPWGENGFFKQEGLGKTLSINRTEKKAMGFMDPY